jgi:hypothetical protein
MDDSLTKLRRLSSCGQYRASLRQAEPPLRMRLEHSTGQGLRPPVKCLEAIRLGCLDKGVDLELIIQQWQVSQLEELDGPSAQRVREWLKGQ